MNKFFQCLLLAHIQMKFVSAYNMRAYTDSLALEYPLKYLCLIADDNQYLS